MVYLLSIEGERHEDRMPIGIFSSIDTIIKHLETDHNIETIIENQILDLDKSGTIISTFDSTFYIEKCKLDSTFDATNYDNKRET